MAGLLTLRVLVPTVLSLSGPVWEFAVELLQPAWTSVVQV